MALKLTTTKKATMNAGLKLLVYGAAGAGKTTLATTTGEPEKTLVISAERGLLSIAHMEIPVAEVESFADLQDVYAYLRKGDHGFEWIILDSISEIAEKVLAYEKKRNPRNKLGAYGEMSEKLTAMLKAFRDLPLHCVMLCALNRTSSESGETYGPLLPGKELKQNIPYWFDGVYPLIPYKGPDGLVDRRFMTQPDGTWEAKDRGGLDLYEDANLAAIKDKIYEVKGALLGDVGIEAPAPEPQKNLSAPRSISNLSKVEAAESARAEGVEAANRRAFAEATVLTQVVVEPVKGGVIESTALDAYDLAMEQIEYLITQHDESILVPFFGSIRKMFKVDDLKDVDVRQLVNFADRLQDRADNQELGVAVAAMMENYTGVK